MPIKRGTEQVVGRGGVVRDQSRMVVFGCDKPCLRQFLLLLLLLLQGRIETSSWKVHPFYHKLETRGTGRSRVKQLTGQGLLLTGGCFACSLVQQSEASWRDQNLGARCAMPRFLAFLDGVRQTVGGVSTCTTMDHATAIFQPKRRSPVFHSGRCKKISGLAGPGVS